MTLKTRCKIPKILIKWFRKLSNILFAFVFKSPIHDFTRHFIISDRRLYPNRQQDYIGDFI